MRVAKIWQKIWSQFLSFPANRATPWQCTLSVLIKQARSIKEIYSPRRINYFIQLASLVNVLLAEIRLYTGLLFEAHLS